jgi:putative transposase
MTLPSGEFPKDEGWEPITPAIPEGSARTIVVRLFPSGCQQRKLRKFAEESAKLWNEINYERRQQFFQEKNVDFKDTWDKYYEKYKKVLGVNAQAVLQKNNEAWSSFFWLLKQKKDLPFINHVSPPGYWKHGGKRKLILVVRQDRYEVDEEKHTLLLKDWKMEIQFSGSLRWFGAQGRLEIRVTGNKFYAHIPVGVGRTTAKKSGKPIKESLVIHGERDKIQVERPKGEKLASIDLGVNMLATVVVNDGTVLFYRGSVVKSDYFYFQERIAGLDKLKSETEKVNELNAREEVLRERKRVFAKLYRRLLHYYRTLASHLAGHLWDLGVSTVYLGYPYFISQDKGNKFTVNMWSYRKLVDAIVNKLYEYGIRTFLVVEYNTSRFCAYHDVKVERNPRGVVNCPFSHKLHSDVNGALNIMKLGVKKIVNALRKPLSFVVTANGVSPLKGSNALDLGGTLAL